MTTNLVCPKCQGSMRSYERNQVTIDQCTECRGIFLDRGELERLMDAEATYNQTPVAAPAVAPQQAGYDAGYQRDHGKSGHHGSGWGPGGQPKRRKSFLGELFD